VLYASNKSAVAQATIFAGFQYTPAAGNYASFYDDNRVGWSLHFDNEAQVGWWCGSSINVIDGGVLFSISSRLLSHRRLPSRSASRASTRPRLASSSSKVPLAVLQCARANE
jgi:hypothetical protein